MRADADFRAAVRRELLRNYMGRTITLVGDGFAAARADTNQVRAEITDLRTETTRLRTDMERGFTAVDARFDQVNAEIQEIRDKLAS